MGSATLNPAQMTTNPTTSSKIPAFNMSFDGTNPLE